MSSVDRAYTTFRRAVAIDYDAVEAIIEDAGGTIHSVDQGAFGKYIVEDVPTPQD